MSNTDRIDMEEDALFMKLAALVKGKTVTSLERQWGLYQAVLYLHKNRIYGDIVECGVWRGGSMMLAAALLKELGDESRTIWLFDTFTGMTEPGDADVPAFGVGAEHFYKAQTLAVGQEEVLANMAKTKYPADKIKTWPGDIRETAIAASHVLSEIALLRLDTDWYDSTLVELQYFYPLVRRHGIVIHDDVGHWKGSKKAVEEYFSDGKFHPLHCRMDYSGVIMVKP